MRACAGVGEITALRSWNRRLPRLLTALALSALGLLAFAGWRHFAPVQAAPGWEYEEFLAPVERVSALAYDAGRSLYISQEFHHGAGDILVLDPSGRLTRLREGLSKPDGMVAFDGGIAFSQEEGRHRVIWTDGHVFRRLFEADSVEELASDGRHLYAVEDLPHTGRLLRYDPDSGRLATLRDHLEQAEAVTVCPDGSIYYAQKSPATVSRLARSPPDPVVLDHLNQPGMLLCDAAGLWVTEDATHQARVLLLDSSGKLQVILSHLRSAQTILPRAPGEYLVAEQGRNRILALHRDAAERAGHG